VRTLVDRALEQYYAVWATGGIPHQVFPSTFDELIPVTGGEPAARGTASSPPRRVDPLCELSEGQARTSPATRNAPDRRVHLVLSESGRLRHAGATVTPPPTRSSAPARGVKNRV
jgi:hypothetical protein